MASSAKEQAGPGSAAPAREAAFKIVLAGDSGTGKTSFVERLLSGSFGEEYVATVGVSVSRFGVPTSIGNFSFSCWDTAGQERSAGLRDAMYASASCAIIMFDVTSRVSYQHLPDWYKRINRVCGDIPIVVCGNKIDRARDRQVKPRNVSFPRRKNMKYFDISVKNKYSLDEPLQHLLRELTGNKQLVILHDEQR